jgi:hypothetical protein
MGFADFFFVDVPARDITLLLSFFSRSRQVLIRDYFRLVEGTAVVHPDIFVEPFLREPASVYPEKGLFTGGMRGHKIPRFTSMIHILRAKGNCAESYAETDGKSGRIHQLDG